MERIARTLRRHRVDDSTLSLALWGALCAVPPVPLLMLARAVWARRHQGCSITLFQLTGRLGTPPTLDTQLHMARGQYPLVYA